MGYFIVLSYFFLHILTRSAIASPVGPNSQILIQISENSKLIGQKEETTSGNGARSYYAFRGVPYAEPPVNQNRWKEPQVLEYTKPEYDVTNYGEQCTQWLGSQVGKEDCLFLNVFTPELPAQAIDVPSANPTGLPVMVYIHASAFVIGGSNAVGPKLLMKRDVVLVTFNHRLGVFGYLSTGNKNLPGNYGALDQIAVLDWVQKYIHKFGGDPNSVTVFGHSAGGAVAQLLTMSPLAKGKFHKVIMQSGSGLSSWIVDKNPSAYAKDFADRAGCHYNISSTDLVDCLQNKTTEELINIQKDKTDFWIFPWILQNVVDAETRGPNAFLPDYPEALMDKSLYDPIPVLTGVTDAEGLMSYAFFHLEEGDKFTDLDYFRNHIIPRVVRAILPFGHFGEVPRIASDVLGEYFTGYNLTQEEQISGVVEIFGDSLFNSGQFNMLEKYATNGLNRVYSYVFTHRTRKSPIIIWNEIKELRSKNINHPLFDSGVSHVDDMNYLFDPCDQFPTDPNFQMSPEDIEFSEFLTGIWAAFARNGNPAEGFVNKTGFPEWKPLEFGSVNYYNLTSVPTPMGSGFRKEKAVFWKGVYESLGK